MAAPQRGQCQTEELSAAALQVPAHQVWREGWTAVVGTAPSERSAPAIGEESEVTDAHEPSGQHMQKESPQELGGAERHLALLAAVGVVLPAKGDVLFLEGQQAMIGDGDAMGVAAEIAQHLHRSTEGGLGIDDPVVAVQAAEEFGELLGIGEGGAGPAQQSCCGGAAVSVRRGTCRERRG